MQDKNMTFEKAISQLGKIVAKLEKGNLSLEQNLELYEQGTSLAAFCKQELDAAKLRVEQIESSSN